MQSLDKNALICDFAEVYHIYDYRGLPASYAAVLAVGLGAESRIKKKIMGISLEMPLLVLQAQTLDVLRMIAWSFSSTKGKNKKPPLVSEMLFESVLHKNNSGVATFSTVEEFEKARQKIIGDKHGKC